MATTMPTAPQAGATAADLAVAAGVGRSTAGKMLARLARSGEIKRAEGGREGARRLPDRFSIAPAAPVAADARPPGAAAVSPAPAASATAETAEDLEPHATAGADAGAERLRPGQLDGLVLAFLEENADTGPHGATAVAKALGRSSGAVGNCLVRLTRTERVREESDKPRSYSLAS